MILIHLGVRFLAKQALGLPNSLWQRSDTLSSPCNQLQLVQPDSSFEILSLEAAEVYNYSDPVLPVSLNFCNVTAVLTHPSEGDYEIVRVWLPLDLWNGRFQATGGGGLATGFLDDALSGPVALGYAAGSSEGGLSLNQTIDAQSGAWILTPESNINVALLTNFAHRSIHDMTVLGKALVHEFYGRQPEFSYYTGCSQGGRQGYFAAQYYPDDFDGILANAPVVNLDLLLASFLWPVVVMENNITPPQCVFELFVDAIIDACDPLDGAEDGLVSNTGDCHFDTRQLIGSTTVNCPGDQVTISSDHADVVSEILEGPRRVSGEQLWWSIQPGTSFYGVADTNVSKDGSLVPVPFPPAAAFMKYFVYRDPNHDLTNVSYAELEAAQDLATARFSEIPGNHDANLTAFAEQGGKLLTWHGMADQFVPHPGSIFYRQLLESNMGGADVVNEFHRLFLAPGGLHCGLGVARGPEPTDPLSALVDWVEKGIAPEILPASTVDGGFTRNLCPWPQTPVYDGTGDVRAAGSFSCKKQLSACHLEHPLIPALTGSD